MSGTFHRDMIVAELAAWWLDTVTPSGPARDASAKTRPAWTKITATLGVMPAWTGEGRARRKVAVGAVEGRPLCLGPSRVRSICPRILDYPLVCLRGGEDEGTTKTTTSNFGVSARENHDSTPFYERFRAPELSDDQDVPQPLPVDEPFVHGDARHMDRIADRSVALVVTSPPYFAGKQYEEELEREGVPASYLEYLKMLTDASAECVRKLEPGGRIVVNVRKPRP